MLTYYPAGVRGAVRRREEERGIIRDVYCVCTVCVLCVLWYCNANTGITLLLPLFRDALHTMRMNEAEGDQQEREKNEEQTLAIASLEAEVADLRGNLEQEKDRARKVRVIT